ncbi:MAG: methyltransferase protein [Bacteroidota bacterium]|nr:methyltransferase protein [Bacteroidota bacterium]
MENKFLSFENRLAKVYKHISKIARKQQLSCFRVYNVDLPEFPFIIDVYKDLVYVAEYKSKHKLSEEEYAEWLSTSLKIIEKVFATDEAHVFLKVRERQKGEQQYAKLNTAKKEMIVDEISINKYTRQTEDKMEILSSPVKNSSDEENYKLSFIVNLSDYLDTGLFLDHRITRQIVKETSNDKRVLNLFSYTGSFSIYAAAGNASKVTTIDLSKTYINWAKRNMQYNKLFDVKKHEFIQDDVLQYLNSIPPASYDLIILDPPTFSNSKRMQDVLDIQNDHVQMINQCLDILADNGILLFSTNHRNFILAQDEIHAHIIKDITKQTTPFDFEGKLKRKCYWIEK